MKTLRLPVALKVVAMDEDVDNDDHIGTGVLTLNYVLAFKRHRHAVVLP